MASKLSNLNISRCGTYRYRITYPIPTGEHSSKRKSRVYSLGTRSLRRAQFLCALINQVIYNHRMQVRCLELDIYEENRRLLAVLDETMKKIDKITFTAPRVGKVEVDTPEEFAQVMKTFADHGLLDLDAAAGQPSLQTNAERVGQRLPVDTGSGSKSNSLRLIYQDPRARR